MDPREGRVSVCRLDIHYLDWDIPDASGTSTDRGAPLILLHGFLDLAWSFAPFVEAFRKQSADAGVPTRRLIALDLRGHGDSGWVHGGYYHFPDYVLDVVGVADGLGIRRFALLGQSMGSVVASLVAGTVPERVERLVLVEGLGPPDMSPDTAPDRFRQWLKDMGRLARRPPRGMASIEEAMERLKGHHPHLTEDLARFLVEKGTHRREDGRLLWKHDPMHRTRGPQPFYLTQVAAFWRQVACPVLFVTGTESPFHAFNDAERRKCFAHGRGVDIQGAGHMIHRDAPERIAEEVIRFLVS